MSEQPDEESSTPAYLEVRLTGTRFDPRGMPADAMPEIKTLSELLFQMAREEWLDEHPERQRVPEGFEKLFDVRLISIGEGSSVPRLVLRRSPHTVGDPDADEMYQAMDRAPRRLYGALESVRDDHALSANFPDKYTGLLAKIGQSLSDEEAIEIAPAPVVSDDGIVVTPSPPPVVLDREFRATIDRIDKVLRARPEPNIDAVGIVTEFDGAGQTFNMKVSNQARTVRCVIASGEFTLARVVKQVLAADGVTAPDVRVRGTATRDARDRLVSLEDVIEVEVVRTVKEKRLMARIELLAALEDGWADPHSLKPQDGVLSAVRLIWQAVARLDVLPDLVARDDGSVAFEVTHDAIHCIAVIEDEGRQMYLFADDGVQDEPSELEAPFEPGRLTYFLETGAIR